MATKSHETLISETALSIVPLEQLTGRPEDKDKPFIPDPEAFKTEAERQHPTSRNQNG